jgi:hypothetical protein
MLKKTLQMCEYPEVFGKKYLGYRKITEVQAGLIFGAPFVPAFYAELQPA